MSDDKRRERPAFPVTTHTDRDHEVVRFGLTIREHYAGLAMLGLLAALPGGVAGAGTEDAIVVDSRRMADKLIAELEKSR